MSTLSTLNTADRYAGDRAAAVTRLFDRLSGVYDTALVQSVMYRPPQDEIIAELGRRRARRIADVGCGTGILATRIWSELPVEVVYGCDASEGMLAHARARTDAVTWLLARSEKLPLPDDSLDAVVSSHAFHFFDQPAALTEFHRVLAPGGCVIVVIVNPRTRFGSRMTSLSTGRAGHFPDERSMRRLMLDAGFATVDQRRVRRGSVGVLSPDLVTVAQVAP